VAHSDWYRILNFRNFQIRIRYGYSKIFRIWIRSQKINIFSPLVGWRAAQKGRLHYRTGQWAAHKDGPAGCTLTCAAEKGGPEDCPFLQAWPSFSATCRTALLCSLPARPYVFCAARQPAENSRFSIGNTALQPARPAGLPVSVIPWLDPPLAWCDHRKPPPCPVRMRSTLLLMRSHTNDHVISRLGTLVLKSGEQKRTKNRRDIASSQNNSHDLSKIDKNYTLW